MTLRDSVFYRVPSSIFLLMHDATIDYASRSINDFIDVHLWGPVLDSVSSSVYEAIEITTTQIFKSYET